MGYGERLQEGSQAGSGKLDGTQQPGSTIIKPVGRAVYSPEIYPDDEGNIWAYRPVEEGGHREEGDKIRGTGVYYR